jgi:uncharacterized heparinase superfamily protein
MHDQVTRLLNTIRYLRAEQVCGQVRRHIVAAMDRRQPRESVPVPAFPGCRWSGPKDILPPATEGIRQDAIEQGVFRFLNTSQEIGFPPRWESDNQPKLWHYNLHYFDWLWVLGFEAGRRVVLDWIGKCGDHSGCVGWEPYPMSLRLINWCGFFFGRFKSETENDRRFCHGLWESVHTQCEWLGRHLETHLLGNHYLENAAALTFVGACFHGDDARRWFDRGMRILSSQVREQILPDGMHFELSPMYQCRILYVLAVLMETEVAQAAALLAEPACRMAEALGRLCHPDGQIALLSDSARGVYHEPEGLLSYCARHLPALATTEYPSGGFSLPASGYYGWRDANGTYLIADFGRIGPDYIPGHGHADIFNFELSLNGHRVVTDSGVHDYETSATRRYCRSTAAHNTVEIDGQDQCELWGAFRMARRGYPRDVTWHSDERGFTLSGWHDGYRRLPGKPAHARQMQWDAADGLAVQDTVTACRPVHCISRLHLHPACRVTRAGGRLVQVSYPGGTCMVEANCDIQVEETPYFERFYEVRTRPCLCMVGRGCNVEIQYRIKHNNIS